MFLYSTNTRYIQCSTVHEYRPARQAIWVIQVVLIASHECSCVTMLELFEGRVNFLQLKWALACGVNSRVGKKSRKCGTLSSHRWLSKEKMPPSNRSRTKTHSEKNSSQRNIQGSFPCAWQLPWLTVEWPWLALAEPFLTLLTQEKWVQKPLLSSCRGTICRYFSENVSKKLWLNFPVLAPSKHGPRRYP